jgi:hypothetical protein
MVQSLSWNRLLVLSLLRACIVDVFLAPPEDISSAEADIIGLACLATSLVSLALFVLPFCVERRPWVWSTYLYGYDERLLLASVRATTDLLD